MLYNLYNLIKNTRILTACPKEEVTKTLCIGERRGPLSESGKTEVFARILANYNLTGKDTRKSFAARIYRVKRYTDENSDEYTWEEHESYIRTLVLRKWLVTDTDGRHIDIRDRKDEIAAYHYTYRPKTPDAVYRRDPVPCAGELSGHRSSTPMYHQALAYLPVDKNILRCLEGRKRAWFTNVKVSQRKPPALRRDRYPSERYLDRSWKTSCKCRKQWQKHKKNIGSSPRNEYWYDTPELLPDISEAWSCAASDCEYSENADRNIA